MAAYTAASTRLASRNHALPSPIEAAYDQAAAGCGGRFDPGRGDGRSRGVRSGHDIPRWDSHGRLFRRRVGCCVVRPRAPRLAPDGRPRYGGGRRDRGFGARGGGWAAAPRRTDPGLWTTRAVGGPRRLPGTRAAATGEPAATPGAVLESAVGWWQGRAERAAGGGPGPGD